jgi:hypothetical protein
MTASGQNFTFQPLNERRHLSAEADQTRTSQECQKLSFSDVPTCSTRFFKNT